MWPAGSPAKTPRSGVPPKHAGDRQSPRLADDRASGCWGRLEELEAFADGAAADGLRDVVLLGMGGSSLAPEVLRRCFGRLGLIARALHVLDSTDAATIRAVEQAIDLAAHAVPRLLQVRGHDRAAVAVRALLGRSSREGRTSSAITDPGSGLEKLAAEHGFRKVFAGDPNIGGRYSALSAFGIVPGALMGVDVRALLRARPSGLADSDIERDGRRRPRLLRAAGGRVAGGGAERARPGGARQADVRRRASRCPSIGLWLEQLVAESTGKHGTGILPVADEPLGDPDVYGEDRVFAYLPDIHAPDAELDRRVQALAEAGHPVFVDPDRRGPPTSAACSCSPSSPSRSPVGAFRSTRSTSPTCSRRRMRPTACSPAMRRQHELPEIADADDAALRALLGDARRPATSRSWVTTALTRVRRGRRGAARDDPRGDEGHDHVRLRPALPALHRPVPQGRTEDRALPATDPRRARGRGDPRASRSRSQRSRTPRRSATWKRCAPWSCPPSACACRGRSRPARCARSPPRSRRCCDRKL